MNSVFPVFGRVHSRLFLEYPVESSWHRYNRLPGNFILLQMGILQKFFRLFNPYIIQVDGKALSRLFFEKLPQVGGGDIKFMREGLQGKPLMKVGIHILHYFETGVLPGIPLLSVVQYSMDIFSSHARVFSKVF